MLCFAMLLILLAMSDANATAQQNYDSKKVEKKPNIIIIYMDDLGYGDAGAYGAG
jgi:hypothetical protein